MLLDILWHDNIFNPSCSESIDNDLWSGTKMIKKFYHPLCTQASLHLASGLLVVLPCHLLVVDKLGQPTTPETDFSGNPSQICLR